MAAGQVSSPPYTPSYPQPYRQSIASLMAAGQPVKRSLLLPSFITPPGEKSHSSKPYVLPTLLRPHLCRWTRWWWALTGWSPTATPPTRSAHMPCPSLQPTTRYGGEPGAAGGRDKPSRAYRQRMAGRGEGEHVWPPLAILHFPSALFSLILSLPSAPSP